MADGPIAYKRYTPDEFHRLFAGDRPGTIPPTSGASQVPPVAGGLWSRFKQGVGVTLTSDEAKWLHDEYQRVLQDRDYWKDQAVGTIGDRAALRTAVEAGPEES